MQENYRSNLVTIEKTRFMPWGTNFAGDPERGGKFRSTARVGDIVIPDEGLARELMDEGFKIRSTAPRAGEEEGFVPTYYAKIKLSFAGKYPPTVRVITDPVNCRWVNLDEDTIEMLDRIRKGKVNVQLNKYFGENGNSLYIRTMYVWQDADDDPWASMFENTEDRLPF
jgi:hypothetical protein